MERYRNLLEDGVIIGIMAVFTVLKQMINEDGEIHWGRTIAKVFTNFVAGWGFYSFLMAYKPWYSEYPQKVGIIMITVYGGSKLIDVIVDAVYKLDFKEIIKRWLGL
jgi:hypothetical protein